MTHAEVLICLGESVMRPRGRVIEANEPLDSTAFARIKLALDLLRARPSVRFRAVVEGWGAEEIVREVY